jgi:hypothetical protein
MKRKEQVWTVIAIVAGIMIYLTTIPRPDTVRQEIDAARDSTIPSGARLSSQPNFLRTKSGVQAHWEFSTHLKWADYRPWVEKELGMQWKRTSQNERAMSFQRQLPNNTDTLNLRTELLPDAELTRIGVTLDGRPD